MILQEKVTVGETGWKTAAGSTILKVKDSAVTVPSCNATAEGDCNQNLSATRNSPESVVLEQASPGSTAEAEVAGTVTDAPVVEAAADRSEPAISEQDKQQLAFVCAVVVIVLKDCGATGPHTKQGWDVPVKLLVTQARDGLKFSDKFCFNKKLIKNVCKAVVKEMKQTFSSAELVSVILTQDPAVETAIVKSIQKHVTEQAPRYQQKKGLISVLKTALEIIVCALTLLVALVIIVMII